MATKKEGKIRCKYSGRERKIDPFDDGKLVKLEKKGDLFVAEFDAPAVFERQADALVRCGELTIKK